MKWMPSWNKTPAVNYPDNDMQEMARYVANPARATSNTNTGNDIGQGLQRTINGGWMNPAHQGQGFTGVMKNALPSFDPDSGINYSGWGMPALTMASGLANTYTGWQNMKTGKDSLNFQKQAFSDQFNMQKKLTNTEMENRAASRHSFNPDAYETADAYMKKHGL